MRTPRPSTTTRRGVSTLIGNGFLHEAPKNIWPHEWDVRGRSAMRKCMFMPAHPPGPHQQQVSPAAMPPLAPKAELPLAVRRRNPEKDVQLMPQVSPYEIARRALLAGERAKALGKPTHEPRAWYEDPVALGSLLILIPPIGLAALWTSKRYSSDARWALTVMTGLMMCLATSVAIALALR